MPTPSIVLHLPRALTPCRPGMVMSTSAFRGLQSSLDSQLAEHRALQLKAAPSKHPFSQLLELGIGKTSDSERGDEKCCIDAHDETRQFSPRYAISDCFSSSCPSPREGIITLTYPYITENLGSETGSEMVVGDCIAAHSPPPGTGKSPARRRRSEERKRSFSGHDFPPPLTTMSGAESLRIEPRREGGRVVMSAVVAPMPHSPLKVERSHGRLRLCLLLDDSTREPDDTGANETENDDIAENEGKREENGREEEEGCDACWRAREEGADENNLKFGFEVGVEKFRRRRLCEGRCLRNENVLNWESYFAATS